MKIYQNLLSCWHKLEHFSPANLPKGLKEFQGTVPWSTFREPIHKGMRIEHTIYLGVFNSKHVTDFVKQYFKDSSEDFNNREGLIFQASFKVDQRGNYLNDSFGISTLPWALNKLENGELSNNDWGKEFHDNKTELEEYLLSFYFGRPTSYKDLLNIQNYIIKFSGWSAKPETSICYKTEEKRVSKVNLEENRSNAEILNSFYIEDIEKLLRIKKETEFPTSLSNYIQGCLNRAVQRLDLSIDIDEIKKTLIPNKTPNGSWTSDYNLNLMQQYAVNKIQEKLAGNNKGIFSVNGPPGTGKTTLLRDLIAANVVNRAKILNKYHEPYSAFEYLGQFEIPNSTYHPIYYELDEELCNTGTVIASSNNGAVENVSKELPQKKETGEFKETISYFRDVAEQCIDKDNWGLISAVLGNKENRNTLVSQLWFNNEEEVTDLRKFLSKSNLTLIDWEEAKKRFNNKLLEVEEEKSRLNRCRLTYEDYIQSLTEYKKLQIKDKECSDVLNTIVVYINQLKDEVKQSKLHFEDALNQLSIIKNSKPNFFIYLFNKQLRNSYKQEFNRSFNELTNSRNQLNDYQNKYQETNSQYEKLKLEASNIHDDLIAQKRKVNRLSEQVTNDRFYLGHNYANHQFWEEINSPKSQNACPWYSTKLKTLQGELFIEALKLHEVFICVANSKSQRVVSSLSAFFEYLKDNRTRLNQKDAKALWDVFFLVFPVVSTTFASVQTMFRDLSSEDIPWLLIDEAGQAVPQAAAGVIYRSKRVVVVGDPLQIEPVVTISPILTNNLRNFFKFDESTVSSELSVQVMADRANPYGITIDNGNTKIWVGTPLKVHRRCINPMFEIANNIAYAGNMVLATDLSKKPQVSFDSRFIHQKGLVDGRHWVKEHGFIVIDILSSEISKAKTLPNIFVITPFNEVAYQLNKLCYGPLINKFKQFFNGEQEELMDIFNNWINTSIGTVHTFQGKQAEGVILCLGLDESSKGAASWASSKPNLLNVALTRAKFRFAAIGDKDIWLKQQYFSELAKLN